MNRKPRFTIRLLLAATLLSAISVVAYLWWNTELEIAELPRPNSGTFTTSDANKLRPEYLSQTVGIRPDHELIQNWKNPYFGFRVHLGKNGTISVTDQFGTTSTGQKSLDDARELMYSMLMGNPGGVLITSDTDGLEKQNELDLVDSLFEPAVQIFIVREKPNGG